MLRAAALMASLVACAGVQAKSHLAKAETRSLGAVSLTVIYMDPLRPLAAYLDRANTAVAPGPVGLAVTEAVNQRRLDEFTARLQTYQTELGMLGIADRLYDRVHGALLEVPWFQKAAWQRLQVPAAGPSVRKLVQQAKTRVVVIVSPRLLMSVDARKLTLRCSMDVEIANPAGSYNVDHYDITENDVTWDVDVDGMPPVPQVPGVVADETGARLATYFAGEARGFRIMYDEVLPKAAAGVYYYFTGEVEPPPAATAAAPAAATR